MAKFCTQCGKELPDGTMFCTNCGAKLALDPIEPMPAPAPVQQSAPAPQPKPVEQPKPVVQPAPAPQPKPAYVPPQPKPVEQPKPAYVPAPQPVPAPVPQPAEKNDGVISTGAYFGLMILFAIPLVNLITCIVLLCASKNKSMKNFAKANLIWIIIEVVLIAALVAMYFIFAEQIQNFVETMFSGYSGPAESSAVIPDTGDIDLNDLFDLFS